MRGVDDGEPVGYSCGAPLEEGREWWRRHMAPPDDASTFAVSEVVVRPDRRKLGIAEQTHEELLSGRSEASPLIKIG
ncbi:hypothetical protein ACFWIQ_19945 [Kitasatospora sp. NPDC127059]|uniref:hypothetical protein n=1 Tax=unclassified Kitasatospora TaxID=2633591 RepID=UPI00365B9ADF